ncbi:3-hydroxybutyrate dehydrogenase [Alteribacter aurantiacus]|uniref:3-hydroxybutyrate dehydrogenase n=1 Tax=Alteribacter aurantiacus TaxID=254410 RepID=UPI000425FFA4|nr:3-hydroxybutyrate dehydrogenase [Alteribacter aurantiacus]
MVEDKVVFITGSAGGIGLEIGVRFAEQKAKVVLSDIKEDELNKAVKSLADKGFTVDGVTCNVTDEEDITRAMNEVIERHGRIDVLINNAGVQHVANIEEFPTEKYELLLKIMLVGPFIATKIAFPHMKKQGFGRILNMASINGVIGFAGKAGYNSAKHGVIGLTKVAALEGAEHGITVNAICPGYVDTPLVRNQLEDLAKSRGIELEKVLEDVIYPLVPQNRLLQVEEIADLAIFLSSDSAKGITGQPVIMDGGYTAQ